MKLEILAADLLAAVQAAADGAAKKNIIPALCCVKLEAGGDALTAAGTNNEVGVARTVPATVTTAGACVVPHEQLAKWLGQVAGVLSLSLDGDSLLLRCGKSKLTLPTQDVHAWPGFPDAVDGAAVATTGAEVGRVLGVALRAAQKEYTHKVFVANGVRVEIGEGGATAEATDGKVALAIDLPGATSGAKGGLLPYHSAQLFRKHAGTGEATLTVGDGGAVLRTGDGVAYTRLLTGRYPPWRKAIPAGGGTTFPVNAVELGAKVRQAAVTQDPDAPALEGDRLEVELRPGGASLKCGSHERGFSEAEAEMPACPLEAATAFMPKYLEAVCKACADSPAGGAMEVEFHADEKKPVVFRWDGGCGILMRMTEAG
jgi:DNA polymerase-3 subunit beta